MQNYQLYNTNVLLGGQQKWDIILESDGNLHIKDFHISPISDNVPYNTVVNEDLLNYSHQENLRSFYKKVQSNFYSICPDPEFSNMWPSMSDKKYSDLYIAGAKRAKTYAIYGKQFEFLCPVWIEYINKPLKFVFEIMGDSGVVIGSKSISFAPVGRSFHDKFVTYFEKYIDYIGLNSTETTGDFSIDLSTKKAEVYGLDVSSGIMKYCNCDYLAKNLVSRERPMMENDFMICDVFKSNHIINHHLFNFNFIFNIDDILSHVVEDTLIGNAMKLNVKVFIGDDKLTKKSFYTNYEAISRYVINSKNNKSANIFSYLNDYKYIDQMDKNKFDQQICHWSIDGNNSYIFNLYKGFGSMYYDHHKRKYMNNRYFNSPDLYRAEYMVHFNNLNWCNFDLDFDLNDMDSFELEKKVLIKENNRTVEKSWEELSSNFNSNWVNNVKYNNDNIDDDLYIYLGLCTGDDFIRIRLYNTLNIDKNISCRFINDKLLIISDKIDLLTFRGFRNTLKTIIFDDIYAMCGDNQELKDTYNALMRLKSKIEDHIIYPKNIKLMSSVSQTLADGPHPSVREVTYVKNDVIKTIQRYDGYLRPTFIDLDDPLFFNFTYVKKDVPEDKMYLLHNYEGYPAIYPSLDYYYVQKHSSSTYIPDSIEYKCMDHSRVLVIEDKIHKIIDKPANFDTTIGEIICIENNVTSDMTYLKSLYKYKYNELENGKYDINIELK